MTCFRLVETKERTQCKVSGSLRLQGQVSSWLGWLCCGEWEQRPCWQELRTSVSGGWGIAGSVFREKSFFALFLQFPCRFEIISKLKFFLNIIKVFFSIIKKGHHLKKSTQKLTLRFILLCGFKNPRMKLQKKIST